MKRRDILTKVPAVAAAAAMVGVSTVEASGKEPKGRHGGFKLLKTWIYSVPVVGGDAFLVDDFVVECPYSIREGADIWTTVADRGERRLGDLVVVTASYGTTNTWCHERTVRFPRFLVHDQDEGDAQKLMGRIGDIQGAIQRLPLQMEGGGAPVSWKVVHVEYRCPDGVEHVVAGIPVEWDSRVMLGVQERRQIV